MLCQIPEASLSPKQLLFFGQPAFFDVAAQGSLRAGLNTLS